MKSYVEDHMRESLAGHVLELHADHEKVKAFYLKGPKNGRMMSSLILFTIEGIVIMGDLTPCQNGVISAYGYGLNWFAGRKSEDYLCEKFLRKEFVPELAEQSFKEQLLRWRRDEPGRISRADARDAWDQLGRLMCDGMDARAFYDLYYETFRDTPECGCGYSRGDAGWLCAIQQRFSILYDEMVGGTR
jgi:hypothetical protein